MDRREFVAALGGGSALAALAPLLEETESVTVVRLPDCVTVDHPPILSPCSLRILTTWDEQQQRAVVVVEHLSESGQVLDYWAFRAERLFVNAAWQSEESLRAAAAEANNADPPA